MKSGDIRGILGGIVIIFLNSHLHANDTITASTSYTIDADRRSLQLTVKNPTDQDMFCQNTQVKLKIAGSEFNDVIGEETLDLGSVYLAPKKLELYSHLRQSQFKVKDGELEPVILHASVQVTDCRSASFVDYCEHAEKSLEDEYTLQKIFHAAKTSGCDAVEERLAGELEITAANLVSVRPIGYLSSLRELYIEKNRIMDLSPLQSLRNLEKLDIYYNPLDNISFVTNLPRIKSIDASYTNVYYEYFARSPSLKSLNLKHTPYWNMIKRPQN